MLGKLVEKMMGGGKVASSRSCLGEYLDKVCPRFAARYAEVCAEQEKAQKEADAAADGAETTVVAVNTDALDVLASMIMAEIHSGKVPDAASRAYLSILLDNEHLPATHRLNETELTLLRELLLGYFGSGEDVNEKGATVLSMIEKKFGAGEFSQARILLQIFDTSPETRQNNERNLYYEDMILRLDMQLPVTRGIDHALATAAASSDAPEETVRNAFSHLSRDCGVNFYLYLHDLLEIERWKDALKTVPESVSEYLYDYVPVISWRLVGSMVEPLDSQIRRHMTFDMLRRHVQQKLRMCYFLLLANGNTGYEWFIFAFTAWSQRVFDVDIREILPMLHRCSVVEGMCLQEILDIVTDRFYGPAMNRISLTPDDLDRAFKTVRSNLFAENGVALPPGDYSLGDFLLDVLLPFDYEDPKFAYRLCAMV